MNMTRPVVPVVFAIALILAVIGMVPTRSEAQTATPAGSPAVVAMEECTDMTWADADVRPPDPNVERVFPVFVSATSGAPPTIEESDRELYLVVITLRPGECIPFDAPGNQKDGAVIWTVQQGKVQYAWKMASDTPPGVTPVVETGNSLRNLGKVREGDVKTLYPGDWITQDQRITVSYRNIGGEAAVILKAVYAVPEGGGCPGDCR
jgi:hypothetical protein